MEEKIRKEPCIRFKGFNDDWEQRKVGDIAEIVRGASPRPIQDPKWFDNENSEIGWLRISDVTEQNGRIHFLEQKISKEGQEKTRVLLEPHLLLSIAATVGKPVINYVKTGVHDGFLIFLNPQFDKEYMFQWLEMFRPQWQQFGQPGSQVNLNSEIVRNAEIFMPTFKEQQKIGNFFTNLDNLITLHQRELELMQQYKKSMLQKMFPKEDANVPEIRFAGFNDAWEQRKLGELTNIKTGSSDLQDAVDNGEYPFFVRSENVERSNRYIFDGEAILIPGEGRLGDIYHYINGKFDYHQRVYKISDFADSNTDGKFVLYYLQQNFKRHALKFTVKATVDSLRLPMLVDFEIKLPNIDEQREVGVFFSNLDNLITLHQQELDSVKKIKKSMLKNMFI